MAAGASGLVVPGSREKAHTTALMKITTRCGEREWRSSASNGWRGGRGEAVKMGKCARRQHLVSAKGGWASHRAATDDRGNGEPRRDNGLHDLGVKREAIQC